MVLAFVSGESVFIVFQFVEVVGVPLNSIA
jgi:hypothetical protein